MSRIVMAWELGAGTGHLAMLSAFGRKLVARGHDVSYLLRHLAGADTDIGGRCLQAPLWLGNTHGQQGLPQNYSEILLRYGYHDVTCLAALVRAWIGMFDLLQADLVVADHAPTALLAARIHGLPAVAVGAGFVVPTKRSPMARLRPWMSVPADRLAAADKWVLDNINQVVASHGGRPLAGVGDLFDVDARFLTTFMELDHYADRLPGDYVGPLDIDAGGETPVWPTGTGKRVFVYMAPDHRDFARIIELLNRMQLRALVCAPGIPETRRETLETAGVKISSRKYRLSELNDCDLGINYGSAGIINAMLRQGIPMLMLPTHLEQFTGAMRVQEYGCGRLINPDEPFPDCVPLFDDLLNNPAYRDNAAKFMQKYAAYRPHEVLDDLVGRIETLAGRNRS